MTYQTRPTFTFRGLLAAIVATSVNLGVVTLLFAGAAPARAASSIEVPSCPKLSRLQAHLIQKAASGSSDLRDYIFLTRGIYALDYVQVVEWLDKVRSQFVACGQLRSPGVEQRL